METESDKLGGMRKTVVIYGDKIEIRSRFLSVWQQRWFVLSEIVLPVLEAGLTIFLWLYRQLPLQYKVKQEPSKYFYIPGYKIYVAGSV